jgi:hypothetical protein
MLTGNNVVIKEIDIEYASLFNKSRVLNRKDKADQFRNLVENFSNMSLKDYLNVVHLLL